MGPGDARRGAAAPGIAADVMAPQRAPLVRRANAVDALRGLGILGVVLGQAKPYEVLPAWMYHAQEPPPTHQADLGIAGLTFPDLVFPIFLFTIGVAIPIAMSRRLERGAGPVRLMLGALSRGALLIFLALFRQHFDAAALDQEPSRLVLAAGLAGFAVLFLVFTRFPETSNPRVRLGARVAGWTAAIAMFALVPLPGGAGFTPQRIDAILVYAAYCVVFGTLVWLLTKHSLLARLAVLALFCSFRLMSELGGWIGAMYEYDPIPWLYRFGFFEYLSITIPGTIVGDLILSWMRSSPLESLGTGSPRPWTPRRSMAVAGLSLLLVPLLLAGIQSRYVLATTAIAAAVCTVLWVLTRRRLTSTEGLVSQLVAWGTFWLVLGLLLDPFEAGTRKLPPTFAWFFQTCGLSIFLLIPLVIVSDVLRKPKWLQLLVDNGQNPMIAYVAYGMLVLPTIGLTGVKDAFEGTEPTPWVAFAWSVLLTLAVAYVARFFTRRRLFWRT